MPSTVINKKIIHKLEELLEILYFEPDASAIIGSFIHNIVDISIPESNLSSKVVRKGKKRKSEGGEENQEPEKQRQKTVKDIRTYFTGKGLSTKKKTPKLQKNIVEIDSK